MGAATAALILAPRLSARYNKQVVAFRLWIFAALFLPVPVILRLLHLFPPPGSDLLLNLLLVYSFIEIAVIIIANVMIGSMMADLAEDSERVTGRRSEGLFFSALSFSSKAITGIGIVIAGIILEVVHFPVGAAFGEVEQRTMTEFGAFAVSTMVIFYLLATYAMSFYGITRASHLQTLAAIESATKMPAPRVSMD